jgi:guanylate kinase
LSNQPLGNRPHGLIFIISAPSGTGKTTLVNMLTKEFPSIVRSISCTTRAPRPSEQEGIDYFFLSKAAFKAKIDQGDFLEHAQVFGDDYGTSQEFVKSQLARGKHVVLVIDTQGALQLKKKIERGHFYFYQPSLSYRVERADEQTQNRNPSVDGRKACLGPP